MIHLSLVELFMRCLLFYNLMIINFTYLNSKTIFNIEDVNELKGTISLFESGSPLANMIYIILVTLVIFKFKFFSMSPGKSKNWLFLQ